MKATLLIGLLLIGPAPTTRLQEKAVADPFHPIRFMEGSWTGTAKGRWGEGSVKRTYSLVLDGAYLHERNTTRYPPQEKNPRGEIHDNWSFFSYDRARKLLVF